MSKETPIVLPKIPSGLLSSGLSLRAAAVLATMLDCFEKGKRTTFDLSEVAVACALELSEITEAFLELADERWLEIPNIKELTPNSSVRITQVCVSAIPIQLGLAGLNQED